MKSVGDKGLTKPAQEEYDPSLFRTQADLTDS